MANLKSTQQLKAFLAGSYSQVDVKAIQAELDALWMKASSSTPGEEHPQVIRACSSNLVLYTDREDAEKVDADLLDEIVQVHPARAILTICRPISEYPRIEAWVSARCHLASSGGGRQVCSEQITVLAEGPVEQELTSVIDSLLLGDLPVFVWWTIEDLNGERIAPFLIKARRLIVDSSRAPYSFSFMRDLHKLVESTLNCVCISDLSWRRLLGIRSAIAEEFERAPLSVADFDNITKIKISTCGHAVNADECSIQSLLLLGWLSSRLGWKASSFEKTSGKPTTAIFNEKTEVQFSTTELENVAPGSIYEVEIELTGGRKVRVSRDPAGEAHSLLVTVSENGKRMRELIADDSDMDRVHLVGYELEELTADPIFAESLSSAIDLVELLEAK